MKRFVVLSLAVAPWVVQAAEQAPAKPDVSKGQQIASQVCVGCHNADGNSVAAANPKLAGQIQDYLSKQLRNFKAVDGKPAERQNPIMNGMVAALSDEDIQSVAAWFSSQQLKPDFAKNRQTLELGKTLYRAGDASRGLPACAGCHGAEGLGMPAQYPRVSGQFAEYIETQLKAFRAGERANDPNKMMRMVADRMTDADIKAVSDYIAGLR